MWLDNFHGIEGLESIFNGERIDNHINLRSVIFENSTVMLGFDLSDWPSSPPKKWAEQGFNTVHCQVALAGCVEADLKHWSPDNIGEFRFKKMEPDGLLSVKFVSRTGVYLSVACIQAVLTKISGYQKDTGSAHESGSGLER